ncbi:MAG: hypothetical protein ABIJ14_03635 [Nanoarchaeota archaeon]|nr:hypothetical protein [Nanoarchaeota archaeon]
MNKYAKSLLVLSLFIIAINLASSIENCTQDWTCTDWSDCMDQKKIRSCVDFNSCENNSLKPLENISCGGCSSKWVCNEWTPKECPEDENLTRICEDINECEVYNDKPSEIKSCEYDERPNKFFYLLVFFIIGLIIITGKELIEQLNKYMLNNQKKGYEMNRKP